MVELEKGAFYSGIKKSELADLPLLIFPTETQILFSNAQTVVPFLGKALIWLYQAMRTSRVVPVCGGKVGMTHTTFLQ